MAIVCYFGYLREFTGVKRDQFEVRRIKDIFKEIEEKYGKEAMKEAKKCSIILNNKNVAFLDGLKTEIKSQDTVMLIQVTMGG